MRVDLKKKLLALAERCEALANAIRATHPELEAGVQKRAHASKR